MSADSEPTETETDLDLPLARFLNLVGYVFRVLRRRSETRTIATWKKRESYLFGMAVNDTSVAPDVGAIFKI